VRGQALDRMQRAIVGREPLRFEELDDMAQGIRRFFFEGQDEIHDAEGVERAADADDDRRRIPSEPSRRRQLAIDFVKSLVDQLQRALSIHGLFRAAVASLTQDPHRGQTAAECLTATRADDSIGRMPSRVLGLITARAGSKGIPGKNVKQLAGKPLIVYTIEAARASGVFDRIMLSTDDEVAAAIARAHGCEVPFMRPAELCTDATPHLPVMQHALTWLRDQERYEPEWVMTLLPTSPLRQPAHLRQAVELARSSGADSVIGVDELPPHFNPMRVVSIDEGGWARLFVGGQPVKRRPGRRQDMPAAWVMNGAIYLFKTECLFDPIEPNLYGDKVAAMVMPPPYGMSLDDPEDWERVEHLTTTLPALP